MNHSLIDGQAVGFAGLSTSGGQSLVDTGWACSEDGDRSSCVKTILVVEDESFVREVTQEVLESAGYRVLIAQNAAEATEIYRERGTEVDLLLTDVILPGETGKQLASKLRWAQPRLRVLFVTGYAEQMGIRRGANEDCLAKPFSADALLERVQRMLAQPEFQPQATQQAMLACVGA